jgi:hypothetical protein
VALRTGVVAGRTTVWCVDCTKTKGKRQKAKVKRQKSRRVAA